MINVLHIDSERGWRGGQQQAAYLLEGLLEKGFKTALICQPDSEFEKYCINNELPYFSVKMRGEIDFLAAKRIAAICRKEKYNILHLHSAHAVSTGLWVKFFYKKLKLIGVRRVIAPIKKNPFSKFKYLSRMIEKHVCISESIKQVMINDGVPSDRLVTIHSGINLKKFNGIRPDADFKKQLGIPSDHIVVGTVAALSKDKDYPNLLRAAKTIIESTVNVTFCAVGTGPDEKEIHRLAEELNLGSRFIFTGYRKDVGNFLNTFDIFVLASYLEGLGTSLLDAQACGLPLIGCNVGGIPEVISHNESGLLVSSKDHWALAEAIRQLILNKSEREKFGFAGKENVKKFTIENTINKNIRLYNQILEVDINN